MKTESLLGVVPRKRIFKDKFRQDLRFIQLEKQHNRLAERCADFVAGNFQKFKITRLARTCSDSAKFIIQAEVPLVPIFAGYSMFEYELWYKSVRNKIADLIMKTLPTGKYQ